MKKETRAMTRRHIFNIVFQYPFYKERSADDILSDYYELLAYEENYELENDKDFEVLEINKEFIKSETEGIYNNIAFIDEVIEKYCVGWSFSRLATVDTAILRIAVYEILFDENIPNSVSANEAVELAKEYSTDKAPSFINGIISNVIKSEKSIT